jgi:hypothetical protein
MSLDSSAVNIYAFAEIGLGAGFDLLTSPNQHHLRSAPSLVQLHLSYSTSEQYDDNPPYGGWAEEDVHRDIVGSINLPPVDDPIPGLEGEHVDILGNKDANNWT